MAAKAMRAPVHNFDAVLAAGKLAFKTEQLYRSGIFDLNGRSMSTIQFLSFNQFSFHNHSADQTYSVASSAKPSFILTTGLYPSSVSIFDVFTVTSRAT